jgi:arylsulfatase A-like enzyme
VGRCFLIIAFAVILRTGALAQTPVILISIDTLRADRLSAYGYTKIHTPNIDAFADDGTLFTNAGTQIPLTLPSHTSLFTSTYPFQNRIEENAEPVGPGAVTLATVLRAHGYQTGAFIGSVFLEKQLGLDRGFDYYDSPFSFAAFSALSGEMLFAGANESRYAARESRDGALVLRAAAAWLEERHNRPFFAFIHLFDLHKPYRVSPDAARQRGISLYDAEVEYVDGALGRFRQTLMRMGLWDRSLVILLSDHGEGLEDHGEDSHGYFLYQSTLWVPLLVHWPKGSANHASRVTEPCGLIDVAPTLLDFLHIAAPPSFEGHSLLADAPHAVYGETVYAHDAFGWAPLRSLRVGDHKYIAAPKPELYDLRSDPHELHNLVNSQSGEASTLRTELAQLLARHAPQPLSANGNMAAGTQAALRSLGYLGSGPGVKLGGGGADPKDRLAEYRLYERAEADGFEGRTDAAMASLRSILQRDPHNTLARRDLGECYVEARAYRQAKGEFQQVLAVAPGDYLSHFGLGVADEHLGLAQEALEQLETACKIAPDAAQCRRELDQARKNDVRR